MTKPTNPQSLKRHMDSIGQLFLTENPSSQLKGMLILKSSSDIGVIRNGGRNGSKYGPKAVLASFKRLTKTTTWNLKQIKEQEVANEEAEKKDFIEAQKQESESISTSLNQEHSMGLLHLGGGHDHVYPLLVALSKNYQKVIVINLDAHADTRTDKEFHSGTPFRQFCQFYPGEFFLFQVGLHDFANSPSTLSPLSRGKQFILWKKEINKENISKMYTQISALIDPQSIVIFSLDADAIDQSQMSAVSATNGDGLRFDEVDSLWEGYRNLKLAHPPIMGIYEYNPVFDNGSGSNARALAAFIFRCFR